MSAEIFIYDAIGPEWLGMASAKWLQAELQAVGSSRAVTVRINSQGGSVTEAQAMFNLLRRHAAKAPVTVEVDGVAASAASYIAMAGDRINMAENALMMIHRVRTTITANVDELQKEIEIVQKFDKILEDTYAARTGLPVEDIRAMLAAETWLTAQEAVDKGFANSIGQALQVAAVVPSGCFDKTPEHAIAAETPRQARRSASIDVVKRQLAMTRAKYGL